MTKAGKNRKPSKSKFTAEEQQRIRDESIAIILDHLSYSKPRKAAPKPPANFMTEWGDDPSTRRVIKRVRTKPLTEAELWQAIQTYFPTELLPPAAACLLEMIKATAAKPTTKTTKKKRGRPPGIGAEVDALMCGPLQVDQDIARRLVAARLSQKKKKRKVMIRPSRAEISAYDAAADASFTKIYNEVAKLHRQWRQKQRKRPAPVA